MIVKLKRREASLERMVFVNEKVHEQDAIVRLQLGKRLEQVLLDKEEAYEELEQLQVRQWERGRESVGEEWVCERVIEWVGEWGS